MSMRKNSKTGALALCAMCAALSFVLLYLGTSTAVLDMSAAVLCGLITVFLVMETGARLTSCAIAVCATLSLVILPDKTVGILYILIGGVYPLVKPVAERLRGVRMWVLKLLTMEVSIGIYVGAMYLFIPAETGKYLIPAAFVLGTLCFLLYDVLLTRFAVIYFRRLRGMFKK